jgi:uncharacterized UBP type Zn finger protein
MSHTSTLVECLRAACIAVIEYKCETPGCRSFGLKVPADQMQLWTKLPDHMMLALSRFNFDSGLQKGVKNSAVITFDEVLDMRQFVARDVVVSDSASKYVLQSVIAHQGRSISVGHNITYHCIGPERWLCFNDRTVTQVTFSEVQTCTPFQCPYMLLYRNTTISS